MTALLDALYVVLADLHVYELKAHNFHWNVTGPAFYQLHLLFDRIYEAAGKDNDRVAEHIKGLGGRTPATMQLFLGLTTLTETPGVPSGQEMVNILLADNEKVMASLENAAMACKKTDSALNEATLNIIADILETRSTIAYLLRSQAGWS